MEKTDVCLACVFISPPKKENVIWRSRTRSSFGHSIGVDGCSAAVGNLTRNREKIYGIWLEQINLFSQERPSEDLSRRLISTCLWWSMLGCDKWSHTSGAKGWTIGSEEKAPALGQQASWLCGRLIIPARLTPNFWNDNHWSEFKECWKQNLMVFYEEKQEAKVTSVACHMRVLLYFSGHASGIDPWYVPMTFIASWRFHVVCCNKSSAAAELR